MSRIGWKKGEVPAFAFCEPLTAGAITPWHIRRISPEIGLKLGGGIDTPTLCGRTLQGWDLNIRIEEGHLDQACRSCAEKYRALAR